MSVVRVRSSVHCSAALAKVPLNALLLTKGFLFTLLPSATVTDAAAAAGALAAAPSTASFACSQPRIGFLFFDGLSRLQQNERASERDSDFLNYAR